MRKAETRTASPGAVGRESAASRIPGAVPHPVVGRIPATHRRRTPGEGIPCPARWLHRVVVTIRPIMGGTPDGALIVIGDAPPNAGALRHVADDGTDDPGPAACRPDGEVDGHQKKNRRRRQCPLRMEDHILKWPLAMELWPHISTDHTSLHQMFTVTNMEFRLTRFHLRDRGTVFQVPRRTKALLALATVRLPQARGT